MIAHPMKRTEPLNFGDLVKAWIKNSHLDGKFREIRMIETWHEVMGPAISRQTGEIYLKDKTLFVHLHSSVLRNELGMRRNKLLELMNEKLKGEGPDKIVLK